MATWCEQPKEPDKSLETHPEVGAVLKTDTELADITSKTEQPGKSEEKEVLGLDELQLRALLDEAITYKNPKDREGKSELFKELLQEAEADESQVKEPLSNKLPRTYYNLPARKKHSRHGSRSECGVGGSSTRSGSLQNLHALGMEGGRGKSRRSGRGDTLVSARQREGGSLPTNVNADNDADLESIIGPNYTTRATLEVSGPQNKEDVPEQASKSTASQSNSQGANPANGVDPESSVAWLSGVAEGKSANNSNSIPFLITDDDFVLEPRYATSCCVGPVESGTIMFPTSPMQHVSVLSIPPQQIHTGSDESQQPKPETKKIVGKKTRRIRSEPAPELPMADDYMEMSTDNFLNLPLTRWNKFSSFTFLDFRDSGMRIPHFPMLGRESGDPQPQSLPKAVDENGNFGVPRVGSENCTDRRKPRRVKTKNDKNVILSDQIEGFRGKDNIEDLMAYIDPSSNLLDKSSKARSNQTNNARSSVRIKAKEECESRSLKRRTKEKFQRCNSLEEISKTKLEDLTEESSSEKVNGSKTSLRKKQVTVDDTQLTKKSTWVTKDTSIKEDKTLYMESKENVEMASPDPIQDTEFHVVTKKQRKKKRRGGSRSGSKPIYYSGKGFPAHDRTLERGGASNLLYQYSHRHSRASQGQQARRKSASSVPPSDKSESSDLDSVHSLPVSSTISRTKSGKNSTSGGSTPQASYADIARNSVSPPIGSLGSISRHHSADPISSPHQHPMLPPTSTLTPSSCLKKDAMTDTNCDMNSPLLREEYPPLGYRNDFHSDHSTKPVRQSRDNNKLPDKLSKTVPENNVIPISEISNSQSTLAEMPTSNSVASLNGKRPPVILLDEPSSIQPSTELTFGFEVNQQLLQCEEVCNKNNTGNINKYVLDKSDRFYRDLEPSSQKLIVYLDSGWNDALAGIELGRTRVYDNRQ